MTKTNIPNFKVKKPHPLSRHPSPGLVVRGRVWIEKDGKLFLGWGRIMLLERIEKLGSIAAAARSMKLGYRNAWLWVDSMNHLSSVPLVENTTGGVGGRHARLTENGRKAIREYKELRARFLEFLGKTV